MLNGQSSKYAFILGQVSALSIAEIRRVLAGRQIGFEEILSTSEVFLIEVNGELDIKELQESMGGIIKIARIIDDVSADKLERKIEEAVQSQSHPAGQRFQFGFSLYGKANAKEFQKIGLVIKRKLKEAGVSCRLVVSKEESLSAVIVKKEHLLEQGLDLVVIKNGGQFYLGQTLSVQDFQGYSDRDYGRPWRDDKSGMLPPKLAKIMINLVSPKPADLILDPFCGSGTVLQEALLMGYQNLIGSDISAKAIANSQNNLNWLKTKYRLSLANVKIYELDVRNLEHKIGSGSVDAIITEPYLGEQYKSKVKSQRTDVLENLYLESFRQFYKVLKPGGKVAIVLPIINGQKMEVLSAVTKIGFVIDKLNQNERGSIVYSRDGQRVEREIFLFKRWTGSVIVEIQYVDIYKIWYIM